MPRVSDRINQAQIEIVKIDGFKFGKHRDCVKRQLEDMDNGRKKSPTKYAFWDGTELTPHQIRKRLQGIKPKCRIVGEMTNPPKHDRIER